MTLWLDKWRWPIIAGIFGFQTALATVLAWRGSQFALIMLAVTSVFLTIMLAVYGRMVTRTLDDWRSSLEKWSITQEWGLKQATILDEVLVELAEYDEEAAVIHSGRASEASLAYLRSFREEDAALVTKAIKEELGG